jgi:hypothetical protein
MVGRQISRSLDLLAPYATGRFVATQQASNQDVDAMGDDV